MTDISEPRFWILRPFADDLFGAKFAFPEVLRPSDYGEPGDMEHCPWRVACRRRRAVA